MVDDLDTLASVYRLRRFPGECDALFEARLKEHIRNMEPEEEKDDGEGE